MTLQVSLDELPVLLEYTAVNETVNVVRGGMSSNASCIMSCLRPLTQSAPHSTDVVRSRAKPSKLWTAVMRGSTCTT